MSWQTYSSAVSWTAFGPDQRINLYPEWHSITPYLAKPSPTLELDDAIMIMSLNLEVSIRSGGVEALRRSAVDYFKYIGTPLSLPDSNLLSAIVWLRQGLVSAEVYLDEIDFSDAIKSTHAFASSPFPRCVSLRFGSDLLFGGSNASESVGYRQQFLDGDTPAIAYGRPSMQFVSGMPIPEAPKENDIYKAVRSQF